MSYDPKRHRRRSIRLKGYDYSQVGGYFITVVTQNRESRFGAVVDGVMQLNNAGAMVQEAWEAMPVHYLGVEIDAFVVMPNHLHGVIILAGPNTRGCSETEGTGKPPATGHPQRVAKTLSLPDVVHRFKSLTTGRYLAGIRENGWPAVSGRLWQRNYFEHIIRDERALNLIREYIAMNPGQWEYDRENPDRTKSPPEGAPQAWQT